MGTLPLRCLATVPAHGFLPARRSHSRLDVAIELHFDCLKDQGKGYSVVEPGHGNSNTFSVKFNLLYHCAPLIFPHTWVL